MSRRGSRRSDAQVLTGSRLGRRLGFLAGSSGAGSGGCTHGATASVFLELYGSRVTITDTTAPALTGPTAGAGLRVPGTRSGDEPLTFSASDNTGIRRAEIVDVTDADDPQVVAAEDYATTQSAQKGKCDYTRTKPCPDLKAETIATARRCPGSRTRPRSRWPCPRPRRWRSRSGSAAWPPGRPP